MSDTESPADPIELVEQHRELFERLADTDLPVSKYFERALRAAEDRDE